MIRKTLADLRACKDRILSAQSRDGLHWKRNAGVRIDVRRTAPFDDEMVYGCCVTKDKGARYRMLYQASRLVGGIWQSRIRAATSLDAMDWVGTADTGIQAGSNTLCRLRVQSPFIPEFDAGLLFFAGTADDRTSRILSARTLDGRNWAIDDRPILAPEDCIRPDGRKVSGICDPSVTRRPDGRYQMFFSATLEDDFNQSIMSATSPDLANWVVAAADPIPQRFDVINNPTILRDGHGLRMWFRCSNRFPLESNIYIASSNNGREWSEPQRCLSFSRFRLRERHGVGFPFVMQDGQILRMYYTGYWGNIFEGQTARTYASIHEKRKRLGARPASRTTASSSD